GKVFPRRPSAAQRALPAGATAVRIPNFSLALSPPLPYTGASAIPGRLGLDGLSLIRQVLGDPTRGRLAIVKRKRRMKAQELRSKTPDQLRDELVSLKKEAFNLRFRQATGQLENTARMNAVRKDVARIKTVLNQKAQEAAK